MKKTFFTSLAMIASISEGARITEDQDDMQTPDIELMLSETDVDVDSDLMNPVCDGNQCFAEPTSLAQAFLEDDDSEYDRDEASCWMRVEGRGGGKPLSHCPPDKEKSGALCYPKCKSGYKGVLRRCYKKRGWG